MSKRSFRLVAIVGLVLAIGNCPHKAGATKVKGFVDYLDVKCDGGKELLETTAGNKDECYQFCKDKKKCKAAQYNKDLEEKCVLFKRCKTWKRAEGWGFAGRVSRRTKYYKPPRGFYCSNCDRVGMTSASSTFKKCLKRCDNTSGCKQVEWNSANYQCTLWSSGLTMYTASMDYVTAKKKRRTR